MLRPAYARNLREARATLATARRAAVAGERTRGNLRAIATVDCRLKLSRCISNRLELIHALQRRVAINKAFKEWEAAHAAYVQLERKLSDAETVFAFTRSDEPLALRAEVSRRRAESDRLLQHAMELLHSRAAAPTPAR